MNDFKRGVQAEAEQQTIRLREWLLDPSYGTYVHREPLVSTEAGAALDALGEASAALAALAEEQA